MKKCLLFLVMVLLLTGCGKNDNDLVMVTEAGFPPYEFYEGEAVWGIDAAMCRAIGDILGMEVKFSDMEFAASLTAVQTGKIKMAMGAITVTEERAKSGNFSDTYYNGKQVIIVAE